MRKRKPKRQYNYTPKVCPICGETFKMLHAHMRFAHIGETVETPEPEPEVKPAPEKPREPFWRRRTPVFGPGQAGLRYPRGGS